MRGFIFTGGPGAGKTTVLNALAARGYATVPESAREIIQERLGRGMTPRPAPTRFAEAILQRDIARYRSVADTNGPVFFDRGIPDALGMLAQTGAIDDATVRRFRDEYPYARIALIFPPWEEIFVGDRERDQTFADSVRIHEELRRWYTALGFTPIDVPRDTVDARCDWILRTVTTALDSGTAGISFVAPCSF